MSRNSRWYTHGVVTLLSFVTLPAAIFGAWPENNSQAFVSARRGFCATKWISGWL